MKSVSGKEFAKVLERNGWVLLRIQRSHHIYGKQGSTVRLSIPIHGTERVRLELLTFRYQFRAVFARLKEFKPDLPPRLRLLL